MNDTTANASTKPFNEMTDAEKRVAVARDTLRHLDSGTILPEKMIYLRDAEYEFVAKGAAVGTPVRDAIGGGPFRVCALGGMFFSLAMASQNVTVDAMVGSWGFGGDDVRRGLLPVFRVEQLELIEEAFEVVPAEHTDHSGVYSPGIWAFALAHRDSTDRLRAIETNIINNHGEFDPTM